MQVNGERLWQRLMDMAAIAATEKGKFTYDPILVQEKIRKLKQK